MDSPSQTWDSAGVCGGLAETDGGVQGSISELYLSGLYTTPIPLLWESNLCVASQVIFVFQNRKKVNIFECLKIMIFFMLNGVLEL